MSGNLGTVCCQWVSYSGGQEAHPATSAPTPTPHPTPGLCRVNLGKSCLSQLTLCLEPGDKAIEGYSGSAPGDAGSCEPPRSSTSRFPDLSQCRQGAPISVQAQDGLLAASAYNGLQGQALALLPQTLPRPRGCICLQGGRALLPPHQVPM